MDSRTTTTTAATQTTPDFTPSGSVLARAWLATVRDRLRPAARKVGYALAEAAGVKAAIPMRHVQDGDVAAWMSGAALAAATGLSLRTVRRAIVELADSGLKIRRCAFTSTYVFPALGTPVGTPVGTPDGTPVEPVPEPTEEETQSTPCRKRVAHPDMPATARQVALVQTMAAERGLASPLPHDVCGITLGSRMTRAEADDWIRYVKAQGGGLVRRVYRTNEPPTAAQCTLLQVVLGVADAPATRGAADAVIQRRAA